MISTLKNKAMSAEEAASLIKDGMTIAISGQVSCGYPKKVTKAIADINADKQFGLNVISTSNNGIVDGILSSAGIVKRRCPMLDNKIIAKQANLSEIQYCEQQMHKLPKLIRSGVLGKIDYFILEASQIEEDGKIILSTGLGLIQTFLEYSDRYIIEINEDQPSFLNGIHDYYQVDWKKPVMLENIDNRIGSESVALDPSKVAAIVYSSGFDDTIILNEISENNRRLANNLYNFLEIERKKQKWDILPPLQTGFGNIAHAVIDGLQQTSFSDLRFFAGHLQDASLRLLLTDKVRAATASSIQVTKDNIEFLEKNSEELQRKLILRNSELINNSEIISRIAPIALNTGIEIDIYGNVNASHVAGNRVINGLGGGANFAHNAGLSIVLVPSESKEGRISNIVPMVSHQDISEHDVDVIVTENGVADLRGKSDIERATEIINCCSNLYKNQLNDYFSYACSKGGHHPIAMDQVFQWYGLLKDKGTMKI